ncbi:MAG: IPT/TIG domain-containing protein, partial [Acidobacteriota bacterium]
IFAFYEPPPPTPYVPTPLPTPVPATPTPTPAIFITAVNPQSVYAGSRGFRLEISGERMQPNAKIYFSQNELATSFVNEQRMVADVPANFIAGEGPRQIIIQTPDGKKYSNSVSLNVQAPPKPQFQYIGMIARKRSNNDTAYFMEQGRQTPLSARLNDIVGGRFRLMSISAEETLFEDVNLGFKHKVPLFRPVAGASTSQAPRPGIPGGETYVPYTPGTNFQVQPGQSIPGIPDNIPRYVPPAANREPDRKGQDDDDDGDGKP